MKIYMSRWDRASGGATCNVYVWAVGKTFIKGRSSHFARQENINI